MNCLQSDPTWAKLVELRKSSSRQGKVRRRKRRRGRRNMRDNEHKRKCGRGGIRRAYAKKVQLQTGSILIHHLKDHIVEVFGYGRNP